MGLKDINKLINEMAEKYKLEGHLDVFGGMTWFVLSLQDKEAKNIDDHYKNGTYHFSTPRYTVENDNADEILKILQEQSEIIEEKLKEKNKE
jgi:hypothetical protein